MIFIKKYQVLCILVATLKIFRGFDGVIDDGGIDDGIGDGVDDGIGDGVDGGVDGGIGGGIELPPFFKLKYLFLYFKYLFIYLEWRIFFYF